MKVKAGKSPVGGWRSGPQYLGLQVLVTPDNRPDWTGSSKLNPVHGLFKLQIANFGGWPVVSQVGSWPLGPTFCSLTSSPQPLGSSPCRPPRRQNSCESCLPSGLSRGLSRLKSRRSW